MATDLEKLVNLARHHAANELVCSGEILEEVNNLIAYQKRRSLLINQTTDVSEVEEAEEETEISAIAKRLLTTALKLTNQSKEMSLLIARVAEAL